MDTSIDVDTGCIDLNDKVKNWLDIDRNKKTCSALIDMIKAKKFTDIKRLLSVRLAFGTAGLRARMGPGYSNMNDVTVIQSTQGFAKYLLKTNENNAKEKGVVIGFDARHNSDRFAKLAAVAMLRLQIPVYLFSSITPTPFVPYGVLKYKAVAGIMITASHNPKDDNGYKVYWSNGAQIIPPHDTNIAQHILQNLDIEPEAWDTDIACKSKLCYDPFNDVFRNYYHDLQNYVVNKERNMTSDVRITYTPMHGVGNDFMKKSFEVFGLKPFISIPQQCKPDPEFPTVIFPNPEEGKSALDLAMKEADGNSSPVIIANDPDADRLACAEKRPDGSWYVFNGNELGAIIGGIAFDTFKMKHPDFPKDKLYMVASTVSSKFLKSMSSAEGFLFDETLTGFKWMANYALKRISEGYTCLLGFEESIGYMYGINVYDKDGISAGPVVAEHATHCYMNNTTLYQYLESLFTKYGYHICNNSYFLCHDPDTITTIFGELRDNGYPKFCGKYQIKYIRDVTTGYDNQYEDKKSRLPVDPSCQMITFTFENGCVATLRTSGTEPKLKYYTEIIGKAGSGAEYKDQLTAELAELVATVVETFLQPERYDLIPKPE